MNMKICVSYLLHTGLIIGLSTGYVGDRVSLYTNARLAENHGFDESVHVAAFENALDIF